MGTMYVSFLDPNAEESEMAQQWVTSARDGHWRDCDKNSMSRDA